MTEVTTETAARIAAEAKADAKAAEKRIAKAKTAKAKGKAKTARRPNGTILPKAKGAKAKAKAPAKKAKPAAAKAGSKGEMLITMLKKGATADALAKKLGWLPHTLRASISTQSRKHGFKVERTRTDGVTSYKIA
jgi:hypothetical protein